MQGWKRNKSKSLPKYCEPGTPQHIYQLYELIESILCVPQRAVAEAQTRRWSHDRSWLPTNTSTDVENFCQSFLWQTHECACVQPQSTRLHRLSLGFGTTTLFDRSRQSPSMTSSMQYGDCPTRVWPVLSLIIKRVMRRINGRLQFSVNC